MGACVPTNAPAGNCQQNSPDLTGLWKVQSSLKLADAVPDAVNAVLNVGKIGSGILRGDLTVIGVPGFASFILGGLVRDALQQFCIPQWAINLFQSLGDLRDVLSDIRVQHDFQFVPVCQGVYRVQERWTRLDFNFRGRVVSKRPEDFPEIGQVVPEVSSARVFCGVVYIDKHRIRDVLTRLLRQVVRESVHAAMCIGAGTCQDIGSNRYTGCDTYGSYSSNGNFSDACDVCNGSDDLSYAMQIIIQDNFCPVFAQLMSDLGSSLGAPFDIYGILWGACNGAAGGMANGFVAALNAAERKLSEMSLQGEAKVISPTAWSEGQWHGSLIGGDFEGTFTATKGTTTR
jgi:hypothetical protein